ncbi:MAG: T9SS type A sorting domain-containing protein, partial [Bacteroidota bacterium]
SQAPNSAHIVWLKGDSATATRLALKYGLVTSGVLSPIVTLREQLYAPDSVVLSVDTAGIVHGGWMEKRPSNLLKLFHLRRIPPDTIVIDSSQTYGPYPGSARFAIQGDGTPHALWNTIFGPRDGLYYSVGRMTPLFNTVKSFTTSFLRANPIALFLRSGNRASAVFEDAGTIRYISDLEANSDTTARILTGFIPRTSNHPVDVSANNEAWLIYGKNLGGSGNRLWLARISDQNSEVNEPTPQGFMLLQNYPNPFNPKTIIEFRTGSREVVRLVIYDLLGREVETLVNEVRAPGMHEAQWDASGVASGVYFYRLYAGGVVQTRRMILMR